MLYKIVLHPHITQTFFLYIYLLMMRLEPILHSQKECVPQLHHISFYKKKININWIGGYQGIKNNFFQTKWVWYPTCSSCIEYVHQWYWLNLPTMSDLDNNPNFYLAFKSITWSCTCIQTGKNSYCSKHLEPAMLDRKTHEV